MGIVLLLLLTPWNSPVSLAAQTAAGQNQGASVSYEEPQELLAVMEGIVAWKYEQEAADAGQPDGAEEDSLLTLLSEGAGGSASDWYALALGRMGYLDEDTSYLAVLEYRVKQRYETADKLDARKATEWHRIALTVLALGGDPTALGSPAYFGQDDGEADGTEAIDLIADGTYDRAKTASLGAQGINGYIWGLICLDAFRYSVPEDAADTRDSMICAILAQQLADGSFTLDGSSASVDITAMALQALAPYYNSEERYSYTRQDGKTLCQTVRSAVDSALEWLSAAQRTDGDFAEWGSPNAESTAQVMLALLALGIDPVNDSRFIQENGNVLDGLMKYYQEDGGFAHSYADDTENPEALAGESNAMAGQQALCALCALYRYRAGMRRFYDFRPEMEETLRTAIDTLDGQISAFDMDAAEADGTEAAAEAVMALWEAYLEIPVTERSYVTQYAKLAAYMEKLGLENDSEFLSEYMNENENGCGAVTDIRSMEQVSTGILFNEKDLERWAALPSVMTGEYETEVVRLYTKLLRAENAAAYAEEAADLAEKLAQLEEIEAEITELNGIIAEQLYPFENITAADRELIASLLARADCLSEYDRTRVLGYEDLQRALAQAESAARQKYIAAAAAALLVVLAAVFAARARRRREARREQKGLLENEKEW